MRAASDGVAEVARCVISGTGKTLMARQIGKMLNAREPKIINGPEILNKFVGQSEENVRKLFEDAEEEQKRVSLPIYSAILLVSNRFLFVYRSYRSLPADFASG